MIFRKDIQQLRGFSFIAIFLFHLDENLFPNGFLGVDIFFVISGFLVTPMIFKVFQNSKSSRDLFSRIKGFAERRILRLGPAFLASATLFTLLVVLLGDAALTKSVLQTNLAANIILGNLAAYKYSGNYFHPNLSNPFIHYWSLSVEEQIYIFLPLVLFFIYFIKKEMFHFLASKVLILVTLISGLIYIFPGLTTSIYSFLSDDPASLAFYSPVSRFWEFGVGGILSFATRRKVFEGRTIKFLPIFLLTLIVMSPTNIPSAALTVLIVILSSMYLLSLYQGEVLQGLRRPLLWLGDRSYSLYLVHMPVIYLVAQNPFTTNIHPVQKGVLSILSVILTVLIGNFLYTHIESRFIQQSRDISPEVNRPRSKKALKFILTYTSLLTLVLSSLSLNDFPKKLSVSRLTNPAATFEDLCKPIALIKQFPCIFPSGENGRTILLIGDSHMSQYSEEIYRVLSKSDFQVIMLGDFVSTSQYENVLRNLKSYSPDAVIVSKLWNESLFMTSNMDSRLQQFLSYSENFLVIGQNPIFRRTVPEAGISTLNVLLGHSLSSKNDSNYFSLDREFTYGDSLIRSWAARSKVIFFDPKIFLCRSSECARFKGKSALYVDGNHLSSTGIALLKPHFESVLERLVKSSG